MILSKLQRIFSFSSIEVVWSCNGRVPSVELPSKQCLNPFNWKNIRPRYVFKASVSIHFWRWLLFFNAVHWKKSQVFQKAHVLVDEWGGWQKFSFLLSREFYHPPHEPMLCLSTPHTVTALCSERFSWLLRLQLRSIDLWRIGQGEGYVITWNAAIKSETWSKGLHWIWRECRRYT